LNARNGIASLPATVDKTALRATLVKDAKLLFEMRGEYLTAAQQADGIALYSSDAASAFACGNPWTNPTTSGCTATTLGARNNQMKACAEMLPPHVSPAASAVPSLLTACMQTIDTIAPLSTTACGGQTYRTQYETIATSLLQKALPVTGSAVGSPALPGEIDAKLRNIQTWYGGLRSTLYPGGTPPTSLVTSTTKVLQGFWKGVNLNTMASTSVSTTNVDAALSTIQGNGFLVDQQVLASAYASTPPLTSLPLLMLTDDALKGIYGRVKDTATYSDVACKFRSCTTPTITSTFFTALADLH